jgi:hypothetical protein
MRRLFGLPIPAAEHKKGDKNDWEHGCCHQ